MDYTLFRRVYPAAATAAGGNNALASRLGVKATSYRRVLLNKAYGPTYFTAYSSTKDICVSFLSLAILYCILTEVVLSLAADAPVERGITPLVLNHETSQRTVKTNRQNEPLQRTVTTKRHIEPLQRTVTTKIQYKSRFGYTIINTKEEEHDTMIGNSLATPNDSS